MNMANMIARRCCNSFNSRAELCGKHQGDGVRQRVRAEELRPQEKRGDWTGSLPLPVRSRTHVRLRCSTRMSVLASICAHHATSPAPQGPADLRPGTRPGSARWPGSPRASAEANGDRSSPRRRGEPHGLWRRCIRILPVCLRPPSPWSITNRSASSSASSRDDAWSAPRCAITRRSARRSTHTSTRAWASMPASETRRGTQLGTPDQRAGQRESLLLPAGEPSIGGAGGSVRPKVSSSQCGSSGLSVGPVQISIRRRVRQVATPPYSITPMRARRRALSVIGSSQATSMLPRPSGPEALTFLSRRSWCPRRWGPTAPSLQRHARRDRG